jgi:hypothetical protein
MAGENRARDLVVFFPPWATRSESVAREANEALCALYDPRRDSLPTWRDLSAIVPHGGLVEISHHRHPAHGGLRLQDVSSSTWDALFRAILRAVPRIEVSLNNDDMFRAMICAIAELRPHVTSFSMCGPTAAVADVFWTLVREGHVEEFTFDWPFVFADDTLAPPDAGTNVLLRTDSAEGRDEEAAEAAKHIARSGLTSIRVFSSVAPSFAARFTADLELLARHGAFVNITRVDVHGVGTPTETDDEADDGTDDDEAAAAAAWDGLFRSLGHIPRLRRLDLGENHFVACMASAMARSPLDVDELEFDVTTNDENATADDFRRALLGKTGDPRPRPWRVRRLTVDCPDFVVRPRELVERLGLHEINTPLSPNEEVSEEVIAELRLTEIKAFRGAVPNVQEALGIFFRERTHLAELLLANGAASSEEPDGSASGFGPASAPAQQPDLEDLGLYGVVVRDLNPARVFKPTIDIARYLRATPSLHRLFISSFSFTPGSIEEIVEICNAGGLPHLRELFIVDVDLGHEDVSQLAYALERETLQLTKLRLEGCNLSDAAIGALARVLTPSPPEYPFPVRLEVLDIAFNQISANSAAALEKAVSANESIRFVRVTDSSRTNVGFETRKQIRLAIASIKRILQERRAAAVSTRTKAAR